MIFYLNITFIFFWQTFVALDTFVWTALSGIRKDSVKVNHFPITLTASIRRFNYTVHAFYVAIGYNMVLSSYWIIYSLMSD